MAMKWIKLCAAPKWMMPRGATKIENLHNDVSIVQYQGVQAPILAQANPVPQQVFRFRDELKTDAEIIAGVSRPLRSSYF